MYPEQRQRWFDFHETMMKEYAQEWVHELNRELEKNPKAKYGDTIIWIK
jgi:hypothetical protein